MRVVAIDIGFSRRTPTIGFAVFSDGELTDAGVTDDVDLLPDGDHAVIEWVTAVWRGRVSDSLELNFHAGRAAALFGTWETVTSTQWGGTRPKKVKAAHARKALSRAELAAIDSRSNHTWDAIAIGLWHHGRF